MQLAFYKAAVGTPWSKAIAWWTKGPYSHVEIVFSRKHSTVYVQEHDWPGQPCFSSAENDGGTRFKYLDINPAQWDTIPVPGDEAPAWLAAEQLLGAAYDWRGILDFVFPWEKENSSKFFCSEVCIKILKQQGLLTKLTNPQTSPNALAKHIKEHGWS